MAAAAGDSLVLPFLFRNHHILVRGVVNDSDSLWFLLDTGAMANVLSRSTADRLGLDVEGGIRARGAGGHAPAGMVTGATLRLPGIEFAGTPLVAIDLDAIALKTGHPCDGVIGAPFFARAVVEIDYARGRVVVRDTAGYTYRGPGAELPLTFEHNHPYVTARLTPAGGTPIEGRYVIDTGATTAILVAPSLVARAKLVESAPRTLRIRLGGVGGVHDARLGRLDRFELGPYALERPIGVFRAPGEGTIGSATADGNLGGEVLRRFRLVFDYARARLFLEPAASFGDPFESDMSGLVLSPREDSTAALEVILVQDDSPAAERGVAVGDVLESVDGAAIRNSGLVALRERLRAPGVTVRLGMIRGTTRREVTLTTRRLL